jgi:hypothetical protein
MGISPGIGYNTYNYVAYIAPIVLLGVSLVAMLIFVYAIILICWPFKKKIQTLADEELSPMLLSKFGGKGNPIPCWTFIIGGLKLVYGHEVSECRHPTKINIYTICGRHVRPWLLAVLFLVIAFVCSCTVVAFWCAFVVTESGQCNEHMDCFARNTSSKALVQQLPLNDCSWYEINNYTIHCFEFSFDYAGALGDAGGVLVLASVIMNVQAGLWIGASSHEGKWAWYLSIAAVATMNLIVEACLIATPIVVQLVPFLSKKLIDTDRHAVQFYTYWATFLSTFTISGPIFIIFSKRLKQQTTIDGMEQYVSTNSKSVPMNNSVAGSEDDERGLDLSDWHRNKYGSA